MKSVLTTIILCLMPIAAFAAEESSSSKKTYDSFRVIFERNIFSKDRLPPQMRPTFNRVPQKRVLAIYVLRGTAAEAGREHRFAFVEEQVGGQSQTVKVGSVILGGVIKGIYPNYVLYEQNGVVRKISIGEEFGQTSTTVYTEETEESKESEQAESASGEETGEQKTPADESELLKQLMERRQRELGT